MFEGHQPSIDLKKSYGLNKTFVQNSPMSRNILVGIIKFKILPTPKGLIL